MDTGLMRRLAIILALMFSVAVAPNAAAGVKGVSHDSEDPAEDVKMTAKKEEIKAEHTSGLTRYDLGIWTLVVFGLLFLILSKTAWKPIMAGLQKREDTLTAFHTDAEKARAEAERLLQEVKAQRAKANEEVVAIIAEARRDADAFRDAEKVRTAADIQAERDRLKREIATARDQALSEIWEKTVQLAALVSSKTIGRVVSADDHRRLIDESLAELNQRLTGSQV